ncbi:hypothetical protein HY745_14520 [Candidatus Desantisbacteria bacterium]|nr:hypothetical protein [Candidatus Desantisbacteria bacterium]
MLYISIFDAKANTSQDEIKKERKEWIKKGKDRVFHEKCKEIKRYEVLGSFPLKIFFIIETNDPCALNLLSHHFGDGWNSITYPITRREIYEALEEDCTIIGG